MKKLIVVFSVSLFFAAWIVFAGGAQEPTPRESGDGFKEIEVEEVLLAYGPDGADNLTTKHSRKGKLRLVF
ncbi:MAG TPA: hypothetical protein ENN41_02165 [Sediminispirochaeta sp.]|nr:hypothetical protein [Sediminispirochaeta sp.]